MKYDLVIIGGGSAGCGAAITAATLGLKTALIERNPDLGGTATLGGVNIWEPGTGGTGLPYDIYKNIKSHHPDAIGIYSFKRHFRWQEKNYWPCYLDKVNFPGGEFLIDKKIHYTDTLRRHLPLKYRNPMRENVSEAEINWTRDHWHGVVFNPRVMSKTLKEMSNATENIDLYLETTFSMVSYDARYINGIILNDGSEIESGLWIDATDGVLCDYIGNRSLFGTDPRELFNEEGAPVDPDPEELNGVSLIYKIEPTSNPRIEPLPEGIPANCWWADYFPYMSCVQYPDNGRNCNMLPTMEGREFIRMSPDSAFKECVRRVKAHWHFIQTNFSEFRKYKMAWIAPVLGIRESRRVICEKMLTERDILLGINRQTDDDIIAISDHAIDRHGNTTGGCTELKQPYGIPFRCLIPKGRKNLLIAGRAAGFSSIAASSCRLSRTMISIGQAAGTAAFIANKRAVTFPDVQSTEIRKLLNKQGVQLNWPCEGEIMKKITYG